MEQTIDPGGFSTEGMPLSQLTATLAAAQQRALEQRMAVEELLAEARSLEERLANETLRARAAAERALAHEHAAMAVAAAQLEREALLRVEATAAHAAEIANRRGGLEAAAAAARAARERAAAEVAECERRLDVARDELAVAISAQGESEARCSHLGADFSAAEADAAAATQQLAEHRAARQRAENASTEAEERARAFGAREDGTDVPSLEPVEELRLLESRIALRAEAAKRAAERRAADLARSHVVH